MQATVWSKDFCGYCDSAKKLLDLKGIAYEERKVGGGYTKEQLLESVPTAKTLPQIFLDGKHIGGYTDLKKYLEEQGV